MPSTERSWLGLGVILLVATGCAATAPSPTQVEATPSPNATTATDTGRARPSPTVIDVPAPGRPFDAATLLAAMRESRRPGGVPDEIETDAIAAALAGAIWTFDGRPWTTTAAGGSCGPETCTLEIAGARAGTAGDDLWVFAVSPATGSVEVVSSDLRSLPTDMLVALDELTRSIDPARVAELRLTSLRWLPPPDEGRFVVSYRSGGEEVSCGADVTLDAVEGAIVSALPVDC